MGTFRVGTLLKINVWESVWRCISIQQPITRSGRMLSDEFLIDLDYVQPVQRGIRLDFPVVASCLRSVSTPVSATMISMTCYKLQNEHSLGPENFFESEKNFDQIFFRPTKKNRPIFFRTRKFFRPFFFGQLFFSTEIFFGRKFFRVRKKFRPIFFSTDQKKFDQHFFRSTFFFRPIFFSTDRKNFDQFFFDQLFFRSKHFSVDFFFRSTKISNLICFQFKAQRLTPSSNGERSK